MTMIDNKKVTDNHQQGIERVKQRKGESSIKTSQPGKMSGVPKEKAHWSRQGDALTPRRG